MSVVWNLKKWLAVERDIYRPTELQALLAEKADVQLSLQSVSALVNGKPSAIRFQTVQALCNALDCKLSDFCDVLPEPVNSKNKSKKTSAKPASRSKQSKQKSEDQDSIFPDPNQFPNHGTGG